MSQRSAPMSFTSLVVATLFIFAVCLNCTEGCQFYPIGEYLKFVRVPENLPKDTEVLSLEVHPRSHLTLMHVDKEEDIQFFTYKEVNKTHISLVLAHSLEDLVDAESSRNLLKFRVICDYADSVDSLVSSHLSVTVYVEDINDHAPIFSNAPYHITVDELTPTGVTIFRGIHAVDRDKPNTPNSDVHYAIVQGNEEGKFSLESGHRTSLILRKLLDYDSGDRQFMLTITATDRGIPPRSTNTTITITVLDNDDLDPKFTQDVYRAEIYEHYPMPDAPIYTELNFTPPIHASDSDRDIDVPLRYNIISGNERGFFYLDPKNGSLFLKRPIDLDAEKNLPANTFALQIHASQVDNPLKMAVARVEIEVLDLNDNLPEFEVDLYNISIVENLPNGFSVLQVMAKDKDQSENGKFVYELKDPSGAFSVDPNTGWLTVKNQRVLDREKRSHIRMKVLAIEKKPSVVLGSGKNAPNSSSVDVEVTLLDANDNNPIFVPGNLYEFLARSDSTVGTVLGQVHAVDDDLGLNGMVKYSLQKPGNSTMRTPPFAVDPQTGVITVAESPILEGRHAVFVEAVDQPANPSERRFSLAVVTVDVFRSEGSQSRDPDFIGAPYEFWVGTNVPVGTSVGQIRVNEAVTTNDLIYDLLHGYHEGVPFAVEERSGTITVVDEIERFGRPTYDFEAVVSDERELTLITNVSIHVVDPADDRGVFKKGTTTGPLVFHVRENVPGAYIGQVLPHNHTESFAIAASTRFLIVNQQDVPDIAITGDGALYAPRGFDRETRQNYSLIVIAERAKGVAIFQVTVIVDDVNDYAPMFTMPIYQGRIIENSRSGTEVVMANRIAAYDKDDGVNGKFGFSLSGNGSELFRIDPIDGRVYFQGAEDHTLDREERSIYEMEIVVKDGGGLKSVSRLNITIGDVNDNLPSFVRMIILPDHGVRLSSEANSEGSSPTGNELVNSFERANDGLQCHRLPLLLIPENATIGVPIIRMLAEDKDEGINAEITYSLANETITAVAMPSQRALGTGHRHFLLDQRTGELSITQRLQPEIDILLTIVAKDTGGLSDNVSVRIHVEDVNDHAPLFDKSWYTYDVSEGTYRRFEIGAVRAIDSDFGDNANVSYHLVPNIRDEKLAKSWTFEVGPEDGVIKVNGILDRENVTTHRFTVVACDNGSPKMNSTVEIEVNVLDVNDNAPIFYGYEGLQDDGHGNCLPSYKASILENSPIGTTVVKIFANDTDFPGNGNGLILFDLTYQPLRKKYFAVDSKDGLIMTVAGLDYEWQKMHRLFVTASDLGSPVSLTSTAIVDVTIIDVDDGNTKIETDKLPKLKHRYYEVEVDENTHVPVFVAQLELEEDDQQEDKIRYSVVADETDGRDHFVVDPKNGSVYLTTDVDRELRYRYEARVRVDRVKTSRGLPVMIYPVVGERINGLAPNEARIVLRIKDVNDNAPRFKSKGRPILAAIPATAHYGYEVVKVEAEDPDEGLNGDIRYQILGREDVPRFAIDPLSGQVRSVTSFARNAGRVFGFDVKATDRGGSESGRSSIANVLVYILDDNRQLVMVVGRKPADVESELHNITATLQNVTGLDVRVRKLEPHIEKNLIDTASTDVYLYAIDPHLNVMINMDTLHNVFNNNRMAIKRVLNEFRVLDIAGNAPRRNGQQRYLLSTLEVGVVVLGCVIFVGALVTALCVACVRRNKRRREKTIFPANSPMGFALADPVGTLQKPSLFPGFVDGMHYDPESYCIDVPGHQSVCEHGANCVRFHPMSGGTKYASRTSGTGKGLEASATSLHSSGQDSGIVARISCHCSHSSSPSSGESSNGYEDSLKSLHQRETSNGQPLRGRHDTASVNSRRGNPSTARRRQRFHSVSNAGSIYSNGMSLPHEQIQQRCCVDTEKRRKSNALAREHRRAHSEAENNITETVIHEHPANQISLPRTLPNTSSLHGTPSGSHMLY